MAAFVSYLSGGCLPIRFAGVSATFHVLAYVSLMCSVHWKTATMASSQPGALDEVTFSVTFPQSPLTLMREIRARCFAQPPPHMVPVMSCQARVKGNEGLDSGQDSDIRKETCAVDIILQLDLCGPDCNTVDSNQALIISAEYPSRGDAWMALQASSFLELCEKRMENVSARVTFFDEGEEVQGPTGKAYLELRSVTNEGQQTFTFMIDSTSWGTLH